MDHTSPSRLSEALIEFRPFFKDLAFIETTEKFNILDPNEIRDVKDTGYQ
jgi:hypothetical protein